MAVEPEQVADPTINTYREGRSILMNEHNNDVTMTDEPMHAEYVLAGDREPSMSGNPHRMSVPATFLTAKDAFSAASKTGIDRRPGFRVEARNVTEWKEVPHD